MNVRNACPERAPAAERNVALAEEVGMNRKVHRPGAIDLRGIALVCGLLCCAAAPVSAATFTVTSTASAGAGSLADAITQANNAVGADTINFSIAGTGVKVLTVPGNGYPQITDTLVINGYTQAGAAVNTVAAGSTNAVLRIELNASAMATTSAVLRLNAPTTLRGVAIGNLPGQANAINVGAAGAGSSIQGCFLGTTTAGTAAGSGDGINATGQTQIGSSAPADRNLFAGVATGVFVSGTGTVIQGNLFGTFANGTTGGSQGVNQGVTVLASSSAVTIGGASAGQGNVFRDISNIAVRLFDGATPPSGVSILGNSIDDVGNVPIDLGIDGVDPIDPGDGDSGPNGRENTANLLYARKHGSQLRVQLQLDGNFTGGSKRFEFFASPTANPSGSGAGAVFLATVTFTSSGVGVRFLDLNLAAPLLPSLTLPQVITATVTGVGGNTSEFSNAVELVDGGALRVVTNINDSGAGSLRQQILDANANAGMDSIIFNLTDGQVHTIAPLTVLPLSTGPLLIDGYSQNGAEPNSATLGSNAVLLIGLDGSNAGTNTLLQATGGPLILRGLNLRNSGNAGVFFSGGSNHVVEGCFIGTGIDGNGDQGNFSSGVGGSVNGIRVGGPGLHQRNVISGNNGAGVNLTGNNWLVQNNVLGPAANGTTGIGNGGGGVAAAGSGGRVVGNRIRNSSGRGIGVPTAAVQVEIAGNDIFVNAGPGIDLNNDGITANDPDDADAGPNGLQNFPVLTSVTSLANGNLRVAGALDRPVAGNHVIRFDVFRSSNCDAGGHGEGEQFLGAATVSFPGGTPETFSFDLAGVSLPSNSVVTATATNATGATSEFSACVNSTLQPEAVFANGFE